MSEANPEAAKGPVVVKKYANRRLYNTESSSYITLENLAEMIRRGRDFVVYDAKTSEDITRGVLTQIIVDEEAKGSAMLPTAFLRQLIGFYGDRLQGVVPRYLEQAMSNFSKQQMQMRAAMGPFIPPGFEELSRQNIAMMERAMGLFNPFLRNTDAGQDEAMAEGEEAPDVQALQAEIASLRAQLAEALIAASSHGSSSAAQAAPEPPRAGEDTTRAAPLAAVPPAPRARVRRPG
jgi:polyhydroxyalkanoate synthesis repressor PhaR